MRLLILLLLCLLLLPAQAQSTPVLYVVAGAPAGGDCSLLAPCPTLTAALARQRSNVTINVAPGVYREFVALSRVNNLTIVGDDATLSGFDLIPRWQVDGDTVYSTDWPHNLGLSGNPWQADGVVIADAARVRTALWVDGVRYNPVFSRPTVANTYWADETGDRLYIRTSGSVPMRAEVAIRQGVLTLVDSADVTVRGITFEGCAASIAAACVSVVNSDRITFENVQVHRAVYAGLQITRSRDVTVRGLTANENGARGFGVDGISTSRVQRVTLEDVSAADNGWRIALAGNAPAGQFDLLGWDSGHKILWSTDTTLRRLRILRTYGVALWADFQNVRLLVDDFVLDGYRRAGFFGEAHCDTPSYVLRNGLLQNIVRETGSSDYFHADIFVTGTNGAVHENLRINSRAANAVLINNFPRTVGSCNPVRGTGNVFRGVTVQRLESGTVLNFASDSTGYIGTTLVDAAYNAGGFRHNGVGVSAEQFTARLAAGSSITQGTSAPTGTATSTATPSATPTSTATATVTASATASATASQTLTPIKTLTHTPTAAPAGRIRIIIDIEWWIEDGR